MSIRRKIVFQPDFSSCIEPVIGLLVALVRCIYAAQVNPSLAPKSNGRTQVVFSCQVPRSNLLYFERKPRV